MRILFLSPTGILGGAERSLLDVLASLRQESPATALGVIAFSGGPLLERAHALGVEVRIVPLPDALQALGDAGLRGDRRRDVFMTMLRKGPGLLPGATRYAFTLRSAIEAFRPDIIHTNGNKAHLYASVASPADLPVVWHVRDFLSDRPLMSKALQLAAPLADAAVANSQAVATDAGGVLSGLPMHVVYNAIDVDDFVPGEPSVSLDELAQLPAAPEGTIRVGLVATYARWKGQDVFIQAAARTQRAGNRPLRFYIVGGPQYRTESSQFSESELRDLAQQLGVGAQVGFVPFQDHPADIFRALDIVVHASTRPEPFGRTIVEAMACAKPVIVSRAGGAAELFEPDVEGIAVRPFDADGLATAIRGLADDASRRAAMGRAARAKAESRFSRHRLGSQLLDVYRSLRPEAQEA